jgi:predicted nucleic acid-binding protein
MRKMAGATLMINSFITIRPAGVLTSLGRVTERVPITYIVHACRDRKDNMILEVAVNGRADLIITGDQKNLLTLGTFQTIPIITPPPTSKACQITFLLLSL